MPKEGDENDNKSFEEHIKQIFKEVDEKDLFLKIVGMAEYASSRLHLNFEDLENFNPSFTTIGIYCRLCSQILKESGNGDKSEVMIRIMNIMEGISIAIADRDSGSLIDFMVILEENKWGDGYDT